MVTGEELGELLRHQHTELRRMLCRMPLLHDCAREDVFLQVRRLLAVHLELESALLLPRLDRVPKHFRLDEEIEAAERERLESIDFDAAQARVALAFLHHEDVEEGLTLEGQLTARDTDTVVVAIQLWDGLGDAYLGNSWTDMVGAVSDQIRQAPG